jgi:hypothetical protein
MSELTHGDKLFHHRPLGKKYNDEARMTNDETSRKPEARGSKKRQQVFANSDFEFHSCFVIRHSSFLPIAKHDNRRVCC